MKTQVVTARLDEETLAKLDALAGAQERSRAWLVAKAVKRYVEEEAAFAAFIAEGEAGEPIPHDEMIARIDTRIAAMHHKAAA